MPRQVDDEITKVTLNLYLKDVEWFREHHKANWSEAVRTALHQCVQQQKMIYAEDDAESQYVKVERP